MHRSIVIRVNTHARLQSAKKQNAAPKRRRASRVSSISLFHSPFPSPRASLSASPFLFPDPQLFVLLNAELPVPDGAREGREKKDKKEARRGWIYASFVHVRYTREGNKWSVNYGTLERKLARTPTFYALNLNPVFLSRGGGGGSDRGVCLLFIVPQASCARSITLPSLRRREKFNLKKCRRLHPPSLAVLSRSPMNTHRSSLLSRKRRPPAFLASEASFLLRLSNFCFKLFKLSFWSILLGC